MKSSDWKPWKVAIREERRLILLKEEATDFFDGSTFSDKYSH